MYASYMYGYVCVQGTQKLSNEWMYKLAADILCESWHKYTFAGIRIVQVCVCDNRTYIRITREKLGYEQNC